MEVVEGRADSGLMCLWVANRMGNRKKHLISECVSEFAPGMQRHQACLTCNITLHSKSAFRPVSPSITNPKSDVSAFTHLAGSGFQGSTHRKDVLLGLGVLTDGRHVPFDALACRPGLNSLAGDHHCDEAALEATAIHPHLDANAKGNIIAGDRAQAAIC